MSFTDGKMIGLYLEPSEIKYFPTEIVFPLLGRGDPIEITAYQLGVARCVNYVEEAGVGRCAIYENRPRHCKSFPVVSRYKVAGACRGIARITDGVDRESLKDELAAHQEKLDLALAAPPNEFIWPLNIRDWVPIGEAR
jgi:Fe-S-cluster containining protein